VKARGQGAVDALTNYEQVVATLDESYNMAVDALATMKDANDELNAVSIAELESKATTSLQNSLISKDEASVWNNAANSEENIRSIFCQYQVFFFFSLCANAESCQHQPAQRHRLVG
jgi:hypothetical protein